MTTKHDEYINQLRKAFKTQKLKVISENNDLFVVQNASNSSFNLQLVISEPIDVEMHGSHNNNKVDGIGVFSFAWPSINNTPDYFVLAFDNLINESVEFLVIESSELLRRIEVRNRIRENKANFWLWLMDDRKVYETTNISLEGEWYYLSKGYVRVADGKDMDFSGYLNSLSLLLS